MTGLPDFTGYLIEEAEEFLKNAGIEYTVSETSSPRKDIDGNEKRVVRQVIKDEVVHIIVCRY